MPQLFISYSREDVTWAEALYERLNHDGVSCFFDKANIRAGDDWELRIKNSLMASQHLLVLWSKEAKSSNWVQRETALFDALIAMDENNSNASNRKLIFLLLDTDQPSHARHQQITHIKDRAAYSGGVRNMDPALWNQVINEVEAATSDDANSIPVSLAILALTSARFDSLYSHDTNEFATSVNEALSAIGIDCSQPSSLRDFKQRYGNRPTDWRPFGGPDNVAEILERVRLEFNQRIDQEGKQIKWMPIGEKFYEGNNADASDELQKVRKFDREHLACFVVDPISLFDSRIVEKLNLLDNFFDDENTLIIVLTPVVFVHHIVLMKWIREKATAFFDRLHHSFVRRRYAHCAMNICAEKDIQRVIRTAVGPHIYPKSRPSRNAYTSPKFE